MKDDFGVVRMCNVRGDFKKRFVREIFLRIVEIN